MLQLPPEAGQTAFRRACGGVIFGRENWTAQVLKMRDDAIPKTKNVVHFLKGTEPTYEEVENADEDILEMDPLQASEDPTFHMSLVDSDTEGTCVLLPR